MKKLVLCFVLCLYATLFSGPIQDRKIDPSALLQLTSTLGISQNADLISETQKKWLRKDNKERWEMTEVCENQVSFVLDWAKEQGFVDAWNPHDKIYDTALLLGATTFRMKERLNYLIGLWNQGICFNEVVWLTGDRPLDPKVDSLTDRCKTESEAARIIWDEANMPEQMRNLPTIFRPVAMKIEGTLTKRPNTKDTINAWLKTSPGSCKALFVSNQPFCGYQFSVIKSVLPQEIQFDIVGPKSDIKKMRTPAATILDSVARWMYMEGK